MTTQKRLNGVQKGIIRITQSINEKVFLKFEISRRRTDKMCSSVEDYLPQTTGGKVKHLQYPKVQYYHRQDFYGKFMKGPARILFSIFF